ncbi:uncharacterized protein BDW47DRAFT_101677 [Aspergillus candidus]|uniref:Tafazzin n=1 Tax=Aspergillus candidus TaxID=41067 RepID=A0A2I2FI00_ASPCN|nr:hypothetical protein BDW47DRAFT_101677 [Aspergillus candidus]PLB40258.1 hypothetical protein BDW47DRAFT_101677 [Aspergillus candidus]
MPKKHQKTTFIKPASTAHHTLSSPGPSPRNQHDRYRQSSSPAASEESSVNDLIHHLRRTQVSAENAPGSPSGFVTARSVHPSLRNLFELPETPPPRPRPGSIRRVGVRGERGRRIAGPPPPESWVSGDQDDEQEMAYDDAATKQVIYRLDLLPGVTFPSRDRLLHMLLKSMALHWTWHLAYDGLFLASLPNHIKVLLLSYVGFYARDQPTRGLMHGLSPLFEKQGTDNRASVAGEEDIATNADSEITRLDLTGAIGNSMDFKRLSSELLRSQRPKPAQDKQKAPVPPSWEDECVGDTDTTPASNTSPILKTLASRGRFENLRFLSLAHPTPAAANWNSLIHLLSRLSTITHLSLAHWPVPTVNPTAIGTRSSHPANRSLTLPYGGTDMYSAMENNWAESAGILRRLSKATYCLKWLDLEGCAGWIPALNWDGVGPNGESYAAGPEWNGSWRDVDFVRLGPGWLPLIDNGEPPLSQDNNARASASSSMSSPSRSLATSAHAPPPFHTRIDDGTTDDLPWDVEVERIKYRRMKELESFRETVKAAKTVQQRILRTRKEGRGKWVEFAFGLEGLDDDVLRAFLGPQYWSLLP